MINENELQISNRSYINKDFASIYPELLDLTKKLTSKWDPETSNESDPGVVLLKLMAFLGDKISYNVDKNVLECFMPSATQESSMRKLCDMMGYEMGYYNASEVELTLTYDGEGELSLEPLSLVVSSNDEDGIPFVLRTNVTLTNDRFVTCVALQGELKDLYILDSSHTKITLDNIDDNNRLYFPIRDVAQNGVFVKNVDGGDYWERKSNLNVVAPNSRVFKFGFDSSRQLPYIEFPVDLTNIIGSGIIVQYLRTRGVDGNVSRGYLTKVIKLKDSDQADKIGVSNVYASFGGANPETIDEAYNSFKKTVGTFDTLVSCRDYSNYIYNMEDAFGYPIVSNVNVTDRRDDINYGTKVLTFEDDGVHFVNVEADVVNGTEEERKKAISANQLCLYPLRSYTTTSISSFVNSFTSLSGTEIPHKITEDLEFSDVKTISHDYKQLNGSDIYLVKNMASLNASIATTKKVNDVESAEILNNVFNALVDNFNARKVDYGYEIPYDSLRKAIEDADNRISSVSLMEPELTTKFMLANGKEVELGSTDGSEPYLKVLARNVVQGKIPLFEYDDSFGYELGQSDGARIDHVKSLRTATETTLQTELTELTNDNTVVQLISPNAVSQIKYQYGVLVKFSGGNPSFASGVDFALSGGITLDVSYKDTNGSEVNVSYLNRIVTFSANVNEGVPSGWQRKGDYYIIPSNGTVEIKKVNSAKLTKTTHCYWIRDNEENVLFPEGKDGDTYRTILGDNEYFFYASDDYTQLVSLGSGTILETEFGDADVWKLGADTKTNFDVVSSGDITSTASVFKDVFFTSAKPFNILETSIVTLTKGDFVKCSETLDLFETVSGQIENSMVSLDDKTIEYRFSDEEEDVRHTFASSGGEFGSYVLARLDVDMDKDRPQLLNDGDYVYVEYKDGESTGNTTIAGGQGVCICSDFLCQKSGDFIDFSSYDFVAKEVTYPHSVFHFTQDDNVIARTARGLSNIISVGPSASPTSPEFSLPMSGKCAVMIYWKAGDEASELSVSLTAVSGQSVSFNILNTDTSSGDIKVGHGKFIVLQMENVAKIAFSSASDGGVTLDRLKYYSGVNEDFGLSASEENDLLEKIREISDGRFYYTADISNDNAIEAKNMKSSYAFFDRNNVANKFTIEQIDFANSSIDIMRSSRV